MNSNKQSPSRRLETTQPADWVDEWERQAAAAGMRLSEFIGHRVNSTLPPSVQKRLSERRPAHRPKGT